MQRSGLVRWLALMLLAAAFLFPARPAALAQGDTPPVVVMRLDGPVNPIWQETIKRAVELDPDEHTQWAFFPLTNLPANISPPIRPVLEKFIEEYGAH